MDPHARGCTQCSEDGGEDADEGLENELPEVLLGIIHGYDCRLNFGIIDRLGHTLVDNLFEYLCKDFLINLFHKLH